MEKITYSNIVSVLESVSLDIDYIFLMIDYIFYGLDFVRVALLVIYS